MTTRPAVTAQGTQETLAKGAQNQASWNARAGAAILCGVLVGSLLAVIVTPTLTSAGSIRAITCTSMVVSIANPSQPFAGLRCS